MKKSTKTIETKFGNLEIKQGGFLLLEGKYRKVIWLDDDGVLLHSKDSDGVAHEKNYYDDKDLKELVLLFYETWEDIRRAAQKTKSLFQRISEFFKKLF